MSGASAPPGNDMETVNSGHVIGIVPDSMVLEQTPTTTLYNTGAVRHVVGGKGRCDLLPMAALLRVSHHMEESLENYPERNWECGLPMHTMMDSALRHIIKYMDGQVDEDHLAAAATNLLMALWTEEKMPKMQDIQPRIDAAEKLNE